MNHQPQRTCVGCGRQRPPAEMLRVAARGGQMPQLSERPKVQGRGAYLCYAPDCARKAWKKRAFERALKLKAPLAAAFKEQVETAISMQITSQESQHMN